jgi:hypothetical protein
LLLHGFLLFGDFMRNFYIFSRILVAVGSKEVTKKIKQAPEGKSKSPWSLYIRYFWKTHFINPPEVRDQVVRLVFYGEKKDNAKVSKSPIWVNRKITEYHTPNSQIFPHYCMNGGRLLMFEVES